MNHVLFLGVRSIALHGYQGIIIAVSGCVDMENYFDFT